MKKYIFLIIFISSQFLVAQTDQINYTDSKGLKQGKWMKYYDNGKVQYEATFLDNKPIGNVKKYYKNGTLKAEMIYAGNIVRTKLYNESGKLTGVGNYINKEKDSTWNYYSDNTNKLVSKENYLNGVKQGKAYVFYEDSVIAEEVTWSNNEKNGSCRTFFPSGKVKSETIYKNDKINGIFNLYFPSGRLEITGKYSDGTRHGKWVFYDKESKIVSEVVYTHGVPDNLDEEIEKIMKELDELDKTKHLLKEPQDQMYND